MARRSSKKREHDFAATAFRVVQEATAGAEETQNQDTAPQDTQGKNPHAVALGRLGGLKGGKARAGKLGPEQRKEIAKKGAEARWATRT